MTMSPGEAMRAGTTRVLRLQACVPRSDRPSEFADDVCFSPELVSVFVDAYTHPGELVFDPFAGFGTTLVTAETMGRNALGFEIDADRVDFALRSLVNPAAVRQVDVRSFNWADLPRFALAIASPPYMTKDDHEQNPLSGYRTLDGDYAQYLRDLQAIYAGIATRAAGPHARIVLNVANLRATRLAWDIGAALSEVMSFEREIILDWDTPQDWFTQDYCLIYRPDPPSH